MDDKVTDKSRRARRKEARVEKNKKKFDSWIHHHQSQKLKKSSSTTKTNNEKLSQKYTPYMQEEESLPNDLNDESDIDADKERDESEHIDSSKKKKKGSIKKSKTKNQLESSNITKKKKRKFEEYLDMELNGISALSNEEDLKLERKLAKKLKAKGGKLGGYDDDLNSILEDAPSVYDEDFIEKSLRKKSKVKPSVQENSNEEEKVVKKHKKKSSEKDQTLEKTDSKEEAAYVPPHLRKKVQGNESNNHTQIRRQLRGLLNRLSESNVEEIAGEVSRIVRTFDRGVGIKIATEEVLASCSGGPRGNAQYAAVFAAFVAGMACLVGSELSANILSSLAMSFEDEYLKKDNLSLRNLTLLLSFLYTFGVCSSDLIYDFMIILSKRLTEVDVSTIMTILECCGMKLRSDDPGVMKQFIHIVQNRVTELNASLDDNQQKTKSRRMEFMLEFIFDIKNNKKKDKNDVFQHARTKKWLQKLSVENVVIRGLKWNNLLNPEKKGQWWLSGDMVSSSNTEDNLRDVAKKIDWEIPETQKMLELAASQRMNTDARRAIFCILMSGEDYIDTFEKLNRLNLSGKQDREIIRVLVECCLQEKVFNKYYCVLASKLCRHDKNHKFSLQYCLWDHLKEIESMHLLRSMHLAKFTAEMLASFTLSIAVLKVVDLCDPQLSPKRIMHLKMLFEAVFEYPDKLIWNIFTRIAALPEYEALRNGILFFITKYIAKDQKDSSLKLKLTKKALKNVEGILL